MTAAYQRPKLTPGQERAVQLDLFGWLNTLRVREIITAAEAAAILRVSPDYIRDLIPQGKFETFSIKGKGKRQTPAQHRLTVRSFLIYVASIATLDAEDWDDLLVTFTDKLDVRSIDRLLDLLPRRRARLSR